MSTYDRVWSGFWSTVAAMGFAVALFEASAIGAVFALCLLLLLCALVRLLVPELMPGWRSLTVGLGLLSVGSFCVVSPSLGLFLVLALGLSSPAVVGRAVRSTRRSTKASPAGRTAQATPERPGPGVDDGYHLTLPETMGPLNGLDDLQLCRLWRESFWVLRKPGPLATVLCLVALREACLEELERRDEAALRAWLDSGARASGGPEKYLTHPPRRDAGATGAWRRRG